MTKERLYRVRFANQLSVYEVYAKSVGPSDMFGFIEIEELVFGETAALVVDPSEERLKIEFEGVKRSYLPLHAILRIDEVEKRGAAKIVELKGKGSPVTPYSTTLYTPHEGE
ncbi:MAG: DUF1820 family protein [Gammaproteobacteria bacterium]|nr:DUF1820 family protein [Gammaproteobacteria bacterium]